MSPANRRWQELAGRARTFLAPPEERGRPNGLEAERLGAQPIASIQDRTRVRLAGVVRAVTLCPVGNAPTFEADLWDGTGAVRVVWLGQREIAGIQPGARLVVEGLAALDRGRPVMRDPRYRLLPEAEAVA
ncbi:MAG: OB-fold nucleic acid binding domain-containing protein [Bifidobacteriaceae bacterium]|jgi:hypothetical protein|nr:OB-fold nucleic acid binding domain-containing protein [Bifidobacteriaceae bacterium]